MVGSMRTFGTDGRTDRRTDGAGYIGPAGRHGESNKYNFSILQYFIKKAEPRLLRKNNHRDSDKNKLRTFEPRGGENFKNVELQRKKSGSYIKKKV